MRSSHGPGHRARNDLSGLDAENLLTERQVLLPPREDLLSVDVAGLDVGDLAVRQDIRFGSGVVFPGNVILCR
jgi:hypothetical protein